MEIFHLQGGIVLTRTLRYTLVVGGALVSILLFLLASASENSAFFDQHYSWLLGLNALVAAALLGLVLLLLTRLYRRYRRRQFGSRLMARLVLLFAIIGILPGLVIYLVSVQFVSRSIESWFDVRVESALESGLNLGRTALDSSLHDLSDKARAISQELADLPDNALVRQLSQRRDQTQEATVLSGNGQVIAVVGGQLATLMPELPTTAMLRQAQMTRGFAAIEGSADTVGGTIGETSAEAQAANALDAATRLRLRVVVAIPNSGNALSLQNDTRFLQLIQPVPTPLAVNAEALRQAYSEYQQRSVARSGLRKIYLVTLTLTLLLAIFGAIASAFLIASDLAKPLLLLAEGTKAVAEGNFSPRPISSSPDELGTLTQSFNTMTRQLYDARAAVEKNRTALENAKTYLESVLANMSAGVMVLDHEFRLVTSNQSVKRILKRDMTSHSGQSLAVVSGLQEFSAIITAAFSEQSAQSAASSVRPDSLHWQKQIEIRRSDEEGDDIALLARGTRLPVEGGLGYLVVFDDISDVISAQRSIAWGEVARRLAHEIKNPLTPIQLSAERLQMKLEDKLGPTDAAMLNKGTATIVNQVTAMKRMVDDFRDYAKTPPAVLTALDLNALIGEILHLYQGDIERGAIRPQLAPTLPHILGDATQLRQVVHNLLQNAQDAVMEHEGDGPAQITIATEEVRYQDADGTSRSAVRLSITDNGPGFAPKILARAFEPYITSKPRGTGLGLAMVKKIIEEHGGRIDIANRTDGSGAKVAILLLKLAS
jgi:nitrogen fixation/metabolism regulation signal transduction histidine kinase